MVYEDVTTPSFEFLKTTTSRIGERLVALLGTKARVLFSADLLGKKVRLRDQKYGNALVMATRVNGDLVPYLVVTWLVRDLIPLLSWRKLHKA